MTKWASKFQRIKKVAIQGEAILKRLRMGAQKVKSCQKKGTDK